MHESDIRLTIEIFLLQLPPSRFFCHLVVYSEAPIIMVPSIEEDTNKNEEFQVNSIIPSWKLLYDFLQ